MSFTRFNDSNTINFKQVIRIIYKLQKKCYTCMIHVNAYTLLTKNIFISVIIILLLKIIVIMYWLVYFILFEHVFKINIGMVFKIIIIICFI